jgi:two-component system chemotaxis response regulator CheY
MKKIRVLVVDDALFTHRAIAKALPGDFFEICGVARNGREGIKMYAELVPDVVTMDVTMPVLDGLAAAREILTADASAKIIMLTARGDEELVAAAKKLGIDVFLQKPFKPGQLVTAIQKICRKE